LELVYKKAGSIELIEYAAGVDSTRHLKNGVVESLVPDIELLTTSLPNGNSNFDDIFSNGMKGKVVVKLSSFQPTLYAALVNGTVTSGTNTIRKIEETTIPAASPYTVVLAKTPAGTPVIHNGDDSPYVSATTPATGQFSYTGASVTFNSADAGAELILAYDVSSATSSKMELDEAASGKKFRMIIGGQAGLYKDEATTKIDAITFDVVKASGAIAWPERSKTPKGWSFTMEVQKPRGGYKPVSYVWEN